VLSPRQSVEMFHLVLLRALAARGEDKALIALKGGCNLRFYFGSTRYSEDIDFDVVTIAKETLRNKIHRLLAGPLVRSPLRTMAIEIVEVTAPKQTETTQRWKVGLKPKGGSVSLRTKIEFSRRGAIDGAAFEATDREVTRPYALTPVLAMHYGLHAAITQKIHALAERSEPQARDVFDLAHLLSRPGAAPELGAAQKTWLAKAIDHAIGISYDDYRSKVVAYLDPDQAVLFEQRTAWESMQETVVAELESLR
jgi:predicted nucleotidyltransferase component of viral defense system